MEEKKKKKYVSIYSGCYYDFEFEEMQAMNEHTIMLEKVKCGLQDKIDLFNAGVVTCFSNIDSLYIDITKAKYVGFELRK